MVTHAPLLLINIQDIFTVLQVLLLMVVAGDVNSHHFLPWRKHLLSQDRGQAKLEKK
jgi:hypothetical protein